MRFRSQVIGVILCGLALSPLTAFAQDNPEFNPPEVGFSVVPFNFAPPGARSLGLGNAFIGVADDATASEANPAGLTILSRPEISVHGLYSKYDIQGTSFTAWSVLYGEGALIPTNRQRYGFPPLMENTAPGENGNAFAGDTTANFDEAETNLTFASFVYPLGRWVVSFYYNAPSNFRGSHDFEVWDDSNADYADLNEQIEVSLEAIGASLAVRLSNRFSLGVSLRRTTFDVLIHEFIRAEYLSMNPDNPQLADPAFYRGMSYEEMLSFVQDNGIGDDYWQRETTINGSDSDMTFNAGLLFKASEKVSLGLVYKRGGEFQIPRTVAAELKAWNGTVNSKEPKESLSKFTLPDFLGLGFAFRPGEQVLIALDINHITYSNLAPLGTTGSDFEILEPVEDGTEFHLGFEYSFFPGNTTKPLSIRAGVFTEEDHDGLATIDSSQTNYTIGFGAVLAEGFQIDFAGRFSDSVTEAALSMVIRF
jgi:long-chain fatty acid transport protein